MPFSIARTTDSAGLRPFTCQTLPELAESHRDMARRLAEQGYVVLLPNIFYRTARTPVFDFQPKFPDERTMKRVGEARRGR